ncbi:MAG: glycoside hydrolase family 16 protein [Aeromicrobium erythreum]
MGTSALRRRTVLAARALGVVLVVGLLASPVAGTDLDDSCGGWAGTKADGTPWECTYDDEFSGPTWDRSTWSAQDTGTSGYTMGTDTAFACYADDDRVIDVADGHLELSVQRLDEPRACGDGRTSRYLAASLMHHGTFSQTYGRYEIRAKVPDLRAKGSQTTFWLWPVDMFAYGTSWPSSGEIDIAEMYSSYPDLAIPFFHYLRKDVDTSRNQNMQTAYDCHIAVGEFNTYVLVWEPGRLTVRINGETCLTNNYSATNAPQDHPDAPFDRPFFLSLTQGIGDQGNEYVDADVPARLTTQVDYVRIWH